MASHLVYNIVPAEIIKGGGGIRSGSHLGARDTCLVDRRTAKEMENATGMFHTHIRKAVN